MRKPRETAADSLWREKLDSVAVANEAIVLLALIGALAVAMLLAG